MFIRAVKYNNKIEFEMRLEVMSDTRVKAFFDSLKGKKAAFCGIGGSNLPLVKIFAEKGALVTACDKRSREQLGETAQELERLGVTLKLGDDYLKDLNAEILFRTPGMRYYMPELMEYRAAGVAVTSEMELFFDLCPCKIYAVTGSDGKTTTTTIISELLKASGKKVHLGGNIGRPLLPDIEAIDAGDVAVVELSSFQLISMRKSPDVAVVTNLAPNHLDIHKDMVEYIDAKKNIISHQNAFGRAVLNADNEITAGFESSVRGQTWLFSRKHPCRYGAWLREDGMILVGNPGIELMKASEIRIPGAHNVENYLAAISAVWGDADPESIRKVAREFNGVEHRMEFVRELHGARYYNDSIGTSPSRTMSGTLSFYPDKIILLAGGYDKKIPFDSLGPVICDKVKTLILMGVTAGKIEDSVKASPNYRQDAPRLLHAASMEEAVRLARDNASAGDVVSLSPACASFDLYPNFEARGNHFKELVNQLD